MWGGVKWVHLEGITGADASLHPSARVSAGERDPPFQVRVSFKVCVGICPLLFRSEMRSFFQAITKNFLQERTNVNLDSFYSTSYYQIKSFSLVVPFPLADPRDLLQHGGDALQQVRIVDDHEIHVGGGDHQPRT